MATFSEQEARELSKLLFEAREEADMWADVVEGRTGRSAAHTRNVIDRIDDFRLAHGWSRHGFGGEKAKEI